MENTKKIFLQEGMLHLLTTSELQALPCTCTPPEYCPEDNQTEPGYTCERCHELYIKAQEVVLMERFDGDESHTQ